MIVTHTMTYHCSSDSCRLSLLSLLSSPSYLPLAVVIVVVVCRALAACHTHTLFSLSHDGMFVVMGLCSAARGGEPNVVTLSVVSQILPFNTGTGNF